MPHTWKLYHDNLRGVTADGGIKTKQLQFLNIKLAMWILQAGQAEPSFGHLERISSGLPSPVAEGVTTGPWGSTEHCASLITSLKYSQTTPRGAKMSPLPPALVFSLVFAASPAGAGDHCLQFLVGPMMAVRICVLVWFLLSVSGPLGSKSVMVSICCCIPASSVVDKFFHQPKITSSWVWTMKTLPTLVFSKRGTKGPKALPACIMSLFLEKANPQCFQIPLLESEGGRKRQKTTLGQNSTEKIKQVMHRFMSVTQFPPLCLSTHPAFPFLDCRSCTVHVLIPEDRQNVTGLLNAL